MQKTASSTMSRASGKLPVLSTLSLSLPWHTYLLLAEAIFMIFKWILPSLCTAELCIQPHALDWSEMAWMFSGLFLLLAAARLAAGRPRPRGFFKTLSH